MFIKKILILFGLFSGVCFSIAQNKKSNFSIDSDYFVGNVLLHDNSLLHLTTGRPEGVAISWNKLTNGEKSWQARYNYPDYGVSFVLQDYNNSILGYNVSLNGHYNFYFLKRRLMLRLGHGIGYSSNPYDKVSNPKNVAISTHLTSSTLVMVNYSSKRLLFDRIRLKAGILFTHHSIGNLNAPNMGVNTLGINAGLTYDFSEKNRVFIPLQDDSAYSKEIGYNIVLRSGANQSDRVGTDLYPFVVFSGYADRKISHINSLQFGADFFLSYFLKDYLEFESLLDDGETDANADFKRAGLFVGHELFINKVSFLTQVGYYIYNPSDFGTPFYIRVGFKYYIKPNFYGVATLKAHGADAETFEFGLGIRL